MTEAFLETAVFAALSAGKIISDNLFTAEKGKGGYLNERRITVSTITAPCLPLTLTIRSVQIMILVWQSLLQAS